MNDLAQLKRWCVAEASYRRGRDLDRWLQMQRVLRQIEALEKTAVDKANAEQCRLIEEYLRATFTEVA